MENLGPPYLLVATPVLLDPNFIQTVVLIGHHDPEGALGWVINRLHDNPARELLAPGHRELVHADTPLHLGGPVPAEALLAVFHERRDGIESAEMSPGLHVSRSPEVLPPLFGPAPAPDLVPGRLIYGYSGWSAGQLEREMDEGVWLAVPYSVDLAFASKVDDLWLRCFDRLGLNPALLTGASGRKH